MTPTGDKTDDSDSSDNPYSPPSVAVDLPEEPSPFAALAAPGGSVFIPGGASAGASVRVEGDGHGVSASIGSDVGRQRFVAGRVSLGNLVFDGAFGIALEADSKAGMAAAARGAVGLDIREWTIDGEPVDFEQAANRL